MTKFNYTCFFLLLLLLKTSCKNRDNNIRYITDFKRTVQVQFVESALLSDLIESDFSYIPLSSDSNHLIGRASRLIFKDSLYFILDGSISKKIFCFHSSGKFNFAFGKVGKGPGEYVSPRDFLIEDDHIYVFDDFSRLVFDRKGNFIQEEKINFWLYEVLPYNNNSVLAYSPTDYSLTGDDTGESKILKILSKSLVEVHAEFFPYEETLDDGSSPGLLFNYKGTYSCSMPVFGQIYGLDSNYNVFPRFKFDFGKYSWPRDLYALKKDQSKMEDIFFKGNVMSVIHRICETEQYFVFQTYMISESNKSSEIDEDNDKWWCIYDKKNEVCYAIHKIVNDIDGGSFSFPITSYSENFVSIIDSDILKNECDNSSFAVLDENRRKKLKEITVSLGPYSNPILLVFQLKPRLNLKLFNQNESS